MSSITPVRGGGTMRASYRAAVDAFDSLHDYLQRNAYKGYEFDDLLSSPLVSALTGGNLLLQRIAVQVGKLSPINFRPLVGVRKLESTKARGFFAKGYLYRYRATGNAAWLRAAEESLEWLLANPTHGFAGISWGNAFDFASRGGFFKKGLPTIVWTSHIAETMEMAYEITGNVRYRDAVIAAGEFALRSLERHTDEMGTCIGYAPGLLLLVHNSNLLAASALVRRWAQDRDPESYELARRSYAWTIAQINPDGSWLYGLGNNGWIDNFHTAYNIDALITGHEIGGEEMVPFGIIERAYRYWLENFFLEDGTPKYYHNATYPLDIQCAAQAIETLSKQARYFPESSALAERVVSWTLGTMRKSNGAFRFQIQRRWRNDLESIHWGEATMLAALGAFLYHEGETARAGEKDV